MRILTLVTIFFAIVNSSFSQNEKEPLLAFKKDSLWHFMDYNGGLLFEPVELVNIGGYSEGYILAIVNYDGKEMWGFINEKGQIAIHDKADQIRKFRDGMAMTIRTTDVKDLYYFGYLDTTGREVIPPIWLDATDFSNGLAWVMNKDRRGYINKQGKFEIEFDENVFGLPFSDGLAPLANDKYKWGYIGRDGEWVIEPQWDEALNFKNGLAMVNDLAKWGYIDTTGKLVIKYGYDWAKDFSDGVAFVAAPDADINPKWGIIDKTGKLNADFIYDDCASFSEGLGLVKQDGKWSYIDQYGRKIIGREFAAAKPFKNGLALVKELDSGMTGLIDPTGEIVMELPEADIFVDLRWNEILK